MRSAFSYSVYPRFALLKPLNTRNTRNEGGQDSSVFLANQRICLVEAYL